MNLQIPSTRTILLVITVLIIGLTLGRCGCSRTKNNPTLLAQLDKDIRVIDSFHKESNKKDDTLQLLRKDSAQALAHQEALAESATNAYAEKSAAEEKTKVYQNKYENARKHLDTMLALASCDSLNLAITKERAKSNTALQACKTELKGLGGILQTRNKEIGVLDRQVASLKQSASVISDALHAVKAAQPTKEPWVKGYIGAAAAFGGPALLNNFGPEVTFIFRNGVLAGVGGKIATTGLVGEVRIGTKITFKKH